LSPIRLRKLLASELRHDSRKGGGGGDALRLCDLCSSFVGGLLLLPLLVLELLLLLIALLSLGLPGPRFIVYVAKKYQLEKYIRHKTTFKQIAKE
jgi:hypothetical protein